MGVSSLRNPVVIRISLAYVYDLAVQLEPLGTLPQVDTPYSEVFMHILNAKFALDRFDTSVFRPYIRSSVALLGQLRTAIDEEAAKTDFDRVLTQYDLYKIRYTFQQFKIVLLAELTVLNTYFVTQKGGFDTLSLLSWGEN